MANTPKDTLTANTVSITSNNPMAGLYAVEETPELTSLLKLADSLNEQMQAAKAANAALWPTIVSKLRVDWTYNSNTLEGSTLTRGETHFFLTEGLTVEGKPFQDFADAKNHAEAIDFLHEVVSNQRPFSESLIKEMNALLLAGVTYTEARNEAGQRVKKKATPGQYKSQPNHVVQADGTIHWYVEPLHVPDEMAELVQWANENGGEMHPIIVAALVHYNLVRIHAFDDGNGRGSRLFMNLLLMRAGYFPAVIRTEKKRAYLDALKQADNGDIQPFISFVASELLETQERVIADLSSSPNGNGGADKKS